MNPGDSPARRAAAAVLAAVYVLALPAAITAAWTRGTVLSTSGYAAAVAPLASDPVVCRSSASYGPASGGLRYDRAGHSVSGEEEAMSVPTGIDAAAPVRAHHEADIGAPLSTAWQLHTDVDNWPAWQTEITSAHLDGAFQPGASFEWNSYGFTVVSTIYAVAEGVRVLWGGTSGGITGIHDWVFSDTPAGVHVTTEESFAGAPVEADIAGMQSALDSSLAAWLVHLKAAAEARG